MVDEGKIALRPAVELSYLTKGEQEMLLDAMEYAGCTPSHAQAIRLRDLSRKGGLGPQAMEKVLGEEKPNQRRRVSVRYEDVRRLLPPDVPFDRAGGYILRALAFYRRHLDRQKAGRGAR